jgi:N-acetylmuramoyl-L-alanine amidase
MLRYLPFTLLFFALKGVAQTPLPPFLTGRTTGEIPYLEYGLGDDRLGGAKMSYLDTNVVLRVVDSVKDDYKVQLSKDHVAWLPKVYFKPDSAVITKPYYLTSSFLVTGDSVYDYISITLDDQLPYRSQQHINPSKITVDIFGATNNTNWVTQRVSALEIKNVYHEQIEDDVFRVTIELTHPDHWGYSIYYKEKKLVIRIKRQPPVLKLENLKIAVDAGHGGSNAGASGKTSKIREKDYTLKIAKELQSELKAANANVFMTREHDSALSMNERWNMIKQQSPDLLISIHLNSSIKDSVSGTSTYYRYIGFRPLTRFIQNRMLETGLKDFGNIGSFNFTLSGPTDYPNCLVEVAFLSNKEDEKKILDPAFHKEVAQKIVLGINDWLASMQ